MSFAESGTNAASHRRAPPNVSARSPRRAQDPSRWLRARAIGTFGQGWSCQLVAIDSGRRRRKPRALSASARKGRAAAISAAWKRRGRRWPCCGTCIPGLWMKGGARGRVAVGEHEAVVPSGKCQRGISIGTPGQSEESTLLRGPVWFEINGSTNCPL